MNKQPSKESLKDKVKGIFGLGPARPPSRQSDSKSSEIIITNDIIKVSRKISSHVYTLSRRVLLNCSHHALWASHITLFQELHPDCGLNTRIRMINYVCELAKTKKFEEVCLLKL